MDATAIFEQLFKPGMCYNGLIYLMYAVLELLRLSFDFRIGDRLEQIDRKRCPFALFLTNSPAERQFGPPPFVARVRAEQLIHLLISFLAIHEGVY